MISQKNKKFKCLVCNKEFNHKLDTKPFCSKHCSYIDLNNWLSEKYLIQTNQEDYEKDT